VPTFNKYIGASKTDRDRNYAWKYFTVRPFKRYFRIRRDWNSPSRFSIASDPFKFLPVNVPRVSSHLPEFRLFRLSNGIFNSARPCSHHISPCLPKHVRLVLGAKIAHRSFPVPISPVFFYLFPPRSHNPSISRQIIVFRCPAFDNFLAAYSFYCSLRDYIQNIRLLYPYDFSIVLPVRLRDLLNVVYSFALSVYFPILPNRPYRIYSTSLPLLKFLR